MPICCSTLALVSPSLRVPVDHHHQHRGLAAGAAAAWRAGSCDIDDTCRVRPARVPRTASGASAEQVLEAADVGQAGSGRGPSPAGGCSCCCRPCGRRASPEARPAAAPARPPWPAPPSPPAPLPRRAAPTSSPVASAPHPGRPPVRDKGTVTGGRRKGSSCQRAHHPYGQHRAHLATSSRSMCSSGAWAPNGSPGP